MSRRRSLGEIEIEAQASEDSDSSVEILSVPGEREEEGYYYGEEGGHSFSEEDIVDDAFGGPLIGADEIELVEKLGEGHFGEVYTGYCRQQRVAVKVPRARLNEEQVAEFKLEIRAMSKLVHPNLVSMLGAYFPPKGDDDSFLMIIIELIEGGDLEQILLSNKPLSLPLRVGWARQVALGMCWLHGGGYVHLDLKPANLLLQRATNIVKIADFGLATLVPKDKGYLSNSAKGTPVYAAPELYLENRVSRECDVYSFGICMYEFIARQMAFDGTTLPDTLEEFFEMVVDGVRPWNSEVPVPAELPKSLVSMVRACWRALPQDRPTFEMVLLSMPQVLVDCAIDEWHAPMREFWLSMCLEDELAESIKIVRFTRYFMRQINAQQGSGSLHFAEPLVRQLFGTKVGGDTVIELETFGRVLGFLPVMTEGFNRDWFLDVAALCQKEWFYGAITSSEAQKKLLGVSKRRFLIRFSSASPHYTISIRTEKNVAHRRLIRSLDGPEVILEKPLAPNVPQTEFKSLDELVRVLSAKLKVKPLPNGPFEWCFANADPYGYGGDGLAGDGYDADV